MIKQYNDFFNPFNSYKGLIYVKDWKNMLETGVIPPPVQLSIDMANVCQFDCAWCNSSETLNGDIMSLDTINIVSDLVKDGFAKALCIGGGGESLCNPHFDVMIEKTYRYANIGVVTNAFLIEKHLDSLLKCKWVGISFDAATSETYNKLKGADRFYTSIRGISLLIQAGHKDVTMKYLVWPGNESEIYDACKLARSLGCLSFQVRPADFPWFMDKKQLYTKDQVDIANNEMIKCRELETDKFHVYTMTQNFGSELERKIDFPKCYVGFFNILIYPNGKVGICVDRRGDESMTMCDIKDLKNIWGSIYHKSFVNNVIIDKCPRCTFRNHNLIFENVVVNNKMYYEFIG